MTPADATQAQGSDAAAQDLQPLVSVVIPAFNASAYIAATLNSVFQQSFSNYEVILVNDGSPDTAELETALQPYLARLRYFRQENRGPSAARNRAIREARGRYIALLDSDDLWLPQHLARQVDRLTQDAGLGLVYANNMQVRDGRFLRHAFDVVAQTGAVTLDSLLGEQCTVNTSSVVASRDALLTAGLFDESMNRCEDFDLWLRLAAQGSGMAYDREVHMIHRLGHGLSSDSALMKRGRANVYHKAEATLPLNAAQKGIVAAKLKELEQQIEIEGAKQHLEAGRFQEARAAVHRANAISPAVKLGFAEVGLRWCPRLARWFYERYIGVLRWYKKRARTPFRNRDNALNLDTWMGQRTIL